MMNNKSFWITLFSLACLGIYLFVSAPPPLDEPKTQAANIPVEQMFTLLQAENAAARSIWTREIVGAGKKVGLKFDEHWRDSDLEAGPLPALFLRETAKSMEKTPVRLSLFLGSDYPISPDNRFEGMQQEKFQILRQSQQPQFFYMPDTRLYTAMFADVAIAEPCIECHNKHEQSLKHDWRLNDVMGAATWMYPAQTVSLEEILKAIMVLHQGIQDAYGAYLEKVKTFAKPPIIGERWPREGYFLPNPETFMQAFLQQTASHSLPFLGALANEQANNLKEQRHVAAE
ncbi:MAG: c-type heme family protein [Methylococcaceae bacterium]